MGKVNLTRSRGRPPADEKRNVAQDLMHAAETALSSKTAKETTIREIAEAAGTNEAMVNYYFGGKKGLIFALLQRMYSESPSHCSNLIIHYCKCEKSIRPLVKSLAIYYSKNQNLLKISIRELSSCLSDYKSNFEKKFTSDTPKLVTSTIESLIEAGIYDRKIMVQFTAMSLMSMLIAPNLFTPAATVLDMDDKRQSDEWIDHVAATIDRSAYSKSMQPYDQMTTTLTPTIHESEKSKLDHPHRQ